MPNLENFDSEDCQKLVPQGSVIQQQSYVRVTLLGLKLDDEILIWEKEDGSIYIPPKGPAKAGLPIWYIYQQAVKETKPKELGINSELKALVSADMVFFPGFGKPPDPALDSIQINEKELLSGKFRDDRVGKLSQNMVKNLLRSRSIIIPTKGGQLLRLEMEPAVFNQTISLEGELPGKVKTQPMFKNISQSFNIIHTENPFESIASGLFNGNFERTVEALLADPRSEPWHDSSLPESDFIRNLNDQNFAYLLQIAQSLSIWTKIVHKAPQPALPSFPIAMVSVFNQIYTLNGYRRGRLVESATIGPDETVTTEVFTFDRLYQERTDEFSSEAESTIERKRNHSVTAEIMSGVQSTVGAGVGGELGLGLPIKMVDVNAGVSGDVRTEITNENQNTAKFLSEASINETERFKATHQVKTMTRHESGTEQRTTRVFKNPNLGRTLNLYHFEVIGEYTVRTEVDQTQRMALLVENPSIGPFERDWIRAHHHFLDEVLLHDVYREGLEAAQILAAQEWIDELAAAEKRAEEEERQRLAETQVTTNASGQSSVNYLPNKGIFATARRLKDKLEIFLALGGLDGAINTIRQHLNIFSAGVSVSKLEAAEKRIARTAWWTQFNLAYPGIQDKAVDFVKTFDAALSNSNQPGSADDVIAAIGDLVETLDDDWQVTLKTFGAGYLLSILVMPYAILDPIVYTYVMKLLYLPDDLGLPKALSEARADYAQHRAKQSVETLAPPAPQVETLETNDRIPPPPRAYTMKELAEAHAALDRLVLHLQAHSEYYSNTYIKREDPTLRMTRLTNLGVAPFVENRLLGFAGNSSIFPLRLEAIPKEVRDALKQFSPENMEVQPEETTVTIPTGGLVSEVTLGACDALEPYLNERRTHDLRERDLRNQLLEAEIEMRRKELNATTDNEDDNE